MHVVTVNFQIAPGFSAQFMRAVTANARESLQRESGCRRFDVCIAQDDENRVFLYELYDTAQDFERHLKTSHFLAFNEATSAWVLSKQVGVYRRA
jgi:autoinducer 2-degrading protein